MALPCPDCCSLPAAAAVACRQGSSLPPRLPTHHCPPCVPQSSCPSTRARSRASGPLSGRRPSTRPGSTRRCAFAAAAAAVRPAAGLNAAAAVRVLHIGGPAPASRRPAKWDAPCLDPCLVRFGCACSTHIAAPASPPRSVRRPSGTLRATPTPLWGSSGRCARRASSSPTAGGPAASTLRTTRRWVRAGGCTVWLDACLCCWAPASACCAGACGGWERLGAPAALPASSLSRSKTRTWPRCPASTSSCGSTFCCWASSRAAATSERHMPAHACTPSPLPRPAHLRPCSPRDTTTGALSSRPTRLPAAPRPSPWPLAPPCLQVHVRGADREQLQDGVCQGPGPPLLRPQPLPHAQWRPGRRRHARP